MDQNEVHGWGCKVCALASEAAAEAVVLLTVCGGGGGETRGWWCLCRDCDENRLPMRCQ